MRTVHKDGERPSARHFPRIYAVVRKVPVGRVVSYGMVAALIDRCTPRIVGYAMASVPEGSDVPWHRVINSQGRISLREGAELQRRLLEAEGVVFDERDRVDLKRFGWKGPGRPTRTPSARGR